MWWSRNGTTSGIFKDSFKPLALTVVVVVFRVVVVVVVL